MNENSNNQEGQLSIEEMKRQLQEYLDSSTVEELKAELEVGDRPILQGLGVFPAPSWMTAPGFSPLEGS